jgi:hypothetical protein
MLDKIRPAGLATAGREDAKKGNALGTHPSNSQYLTPVQAPIRAQLIGSSSCAHRTVADKTVLALCQLLVQAGFNPDRPLHCKAADITARGQGPPMPLNRRGVA